MAYLAERRVYSSTTNVLVMIRQEHDISCLYLEEYEYNPIENIQCIVTGTCGLHEGGAHGCVLAENLNSIPLLHPPPSTSGR